MKKKQHYVPQMILKHFSITGEADKCWEYNLHNNAIAIKKIKELCYQKYLYEIRDEDGNYMYPAGINAVEDGFSKIENIYGPFLETLLLKLEHAKESIVLDINEIESINTWISFIISRNPVILQAIPYAAKEIGTSIEKKAGKSYVFLEYMPDLMDRFYKDLKKGHIEVLKASERYSFVISDIPVIIKGEPLYEFCYTPISSRYAIEIKKPETIITNINNCFIRDLSSAETMKYNTKIYNALLNSHNSEFSFGNSIIACDQNVLRQLVFPNMK